MFDPMENRLANHLKRIGQADRSLRDHGKDPESFVLVCAGAMTREIIHRGWDDSWATPTAEDIDDLEELGYVRTEDPRKSKRIFAPTVKGREQATALVVSSGQATRGRSPGINDILAWLLVQETDSPDAFGSPGSLIDMAIQEGFIKPGSEDALADRIVDLFGEGYLVGNVPELDQLSSRELLRLSDGLRLTMKAHRQSQYPESGRTSAINFHGTVVAGQIAAGDISNYVSFGNLLDSAEEAITALEHVEEADRDDALSLIEILRGRAPEVGERLLIGAGGGLLSTVLAQLLGMG